MQILSSRTTALFLLAFCAPSQAIHPYEDLVQHEQAHQLPSEWRYHAPAAPHELLNLRVGLHQPTAHITKIAELVSDPDSPRYGQHLSAEELHGMLPNVDEAARNVRSWLESHGISNIDMRGEWCHFTSTVAQAKSMMNADFARFRYKDEEPVLRTTAYSIPKTMANDIDFIFPTTHFLGSWLKDKSAALVPRQRLPPGPPTCQNATCPSKLRTLYNINYQPPNKSKSKLGVAGFLEQYASQTDLNTFLTKYNQQSTPPSYSTPYTFNVELVNGGKNPTAPNVSGVEAMLDIDYTMAFTKPLDVTFFSTGGRPPTLNEYGNKTVLPKDSQNEPFLEFLQYLSAKTEPPQVISISYSDSEQTVPIKYAQRVCDLFARLAARGVSVIGASGDGGAAGTSRGDCIGPDGKKRFVPTFPSSCPWITSVGALAAYGGVAGYSSGGFSNYFGVPAWQKASTQQYVKALNGSHNGYYNKTGRGIPDVTLLGDDFLIVSGGVPSSHDGTSASTPVFASIITLLNDLRLRAGKPVLGHLNPWLYSNNVRATFADVKTGFGIDGCADANSFEEGFEPRAGWDAASGLGTPDFAKLRKLI